MSGGREGSSEGGDDGSAGFGPRRAARLAAVQALYQIELAGDEPESTILEFLRHRHGPMIEDQETPEMDGDFFSDLVRGACRRGVEVDERISGALSAGWRLERLETVMRAILRAGVYELMLRDDVPARATINEYVEAAHAYFSGEEPKFANAVLDRIARGVRAEEFVSAKRS